MVVTWKDSDYFATQVKAIEMSIINFMTDSSPCNLLAQQKSFFIVEDKCKI